MKILKNIKLLCALLCIAALYSCDKYLDIQPVGKVIPRTAAEFRALLTQAYSYVPDDNGWNSCCRRFEFLQGYMDME